MKMLCINDTGWEYKRRWLFGLITFWRSNHGPRYMEEVTVIASEPGEEGEYYLLKEYPGDNWYAACEFIPLSDIDECEIAQSRKGKQNA